MFLEDQDLGRQPFKPEEIVVQWLQMTGMCAFGLKGIRRMEETNMNKSALYQLSYGVYVVSTWDKGRATGCTANSAMQITSNPATVAVSINHDNYTNQCIAETGKFAVSILGEHTDPSVIGTFGFYSGKDIDKFEKVQPVMKEYMPVVEDACAYIVCEVIDKMETSSHTVFLGKVIDADVLKKDDPMTYAYYHNVIKGKSPKNAPTYQGE